MPTETKIEWCDYSSNPIRARRRDNGKGHWACVKVSPGCLHCYAETINKRFGTGLDYAARSMKLVEPYLDEREMERLLKSKKLAGKRVFIGDMTDIFGEWVEDAWLDKLFGMFAMREDVTWIVLTKRAERMDRYFGAGNRAAFADRGFAIYEAAEKFIIERDGDYAKYASIVSLPLANVWLGVSCENQATADERIPLLLKTPAAVRFVSAEPLLGPIDFRRLASGTRYLDAFTLDMCRGDEVIAGPPSGWGPLDWVIVGGESGPGARDCDVRWIEDIVKQCRDAGVPVFVKQFGSKPYISTPSYPMGGGPSWMEDYEVLKLKDPKGGDMAEWPEGLRVREFPAVKETA